MSTKENNQVAVQEKNICDSVLSKINAFQAAKQIRMPSDYSPENALKSAYLILSETKNRDGQFALQYCTPTSIANALLKMVVNGLTPLKKQCDFIMYGNVLECSIEYTGNIVLAKRFGDLKHIVANAVYKGDEFDFTTDPSTGLKQITKHKQTLESIGSKDVVGAYAVYTLGDGTVNVEIMSMNQIRDAWNQGSMKGNSPAHKNFPDEMAKKTVINRACKLIVRGSDDAVLYEVDENEPKDKAYEDAKFEVVSNSNKTPLDITETQKEIMADSKESNTISIDIKEESKREGVTNVNEANFQAETGPGF